MPETTDVRQGEYATRGDYHRAPDDNWDYWPTYLAKMRWVRRHLDRLTAGTRVLDVGCGEGVLLDEYIGRLAIEGVDLNYASGRVRQGSLLNLPFEDGHFDVVLCLDVLEHLRLDQQAVAVAEIRRVLAPDGRVLLSVPNLAHLQSRLHFMFAGRLIRTASEQKHPGDRPIRDYLQLLRRVGLVIVERHGIFPTIPVLTHFVRRHPRRLAIAHRWLTRLLPVPGWCFLNVIVARRVDGA